jgi:transcriptional regulator with XRE-family HTH domain
MNTASDIIGMRLKKIRNNRNLSLYETAQLTGVSKPMLGQIERGQSSPTVNVLWKIATGLKVPLSSLLEEPSSEYAIATLQEKNIIVKDDGRMKAYPLFAYDPVRSVESFFINFEAQCHHTSEKHSDGVEEYIFVLQGTLQLVLNEKKIIVREKQAIRFRADIRHEYHNPFDEKCTVYNMIFYPNE